MRIRPWLQPLIQKTSLTTRRSSRKRYTKQVRSAELVESRTMLSAQVLFANGGLVVLANGIENITVRENPQTAGQAEVLIDGTPSPGNFLATQITSIDIQLDGNGNTVDVSSLTKTVFNNLASISITTGNGDDIINGSVDFAEHIESGDGDDVITSLGGNDSIFASNGNDTIQAGDGNDFVDAGNGQDSVNAGLGADSVIGGDGLDTLQGGDGDDTLAAGQGNDQVAGENGNDSISGEAGTDTLDGGAGNDSVFGGAGNDLISAGDGNDYVLGNSGNDSITGGNGNDSIYGQNGVDELNGGAGDDNIIGGLDSDLVVGDQGNDTVFGGGGADNIYGDTEDVSLPISGADVLRGQGGNDTINGGSGPDLLDGGAGNDVVQTNDGAANSVPQISIRDVISANETDAAAFNFDRYDVVSYGSGSNGFGRSIEMGDMDGDGDLDLVSLFDNFVSVQLNQGNGIFSTGVAYSAPSGLPEELILADVDSDGDLDVTTAIRLSPSNQFPLGHVLFNDGSSVLSAPTLVGSQAFGAMGHAVGDVDGDGDVDLVFVTALQNEVQVFANDGVGNFTQLSVYALGFRVSAEDIDLADIDGDGDLDAAVVDGAQSQLVFLRNIGNGTFQPAGSVTTTANSFNVVHIEQGDWDNDGDIDFATANTFGGISIITNNGTGTFALAQTLATSGLIFDDALAAGDLDSDGDLDLIASVNSQNGLQAFVNTNGVFGNPTSFNPVGAGFLSILNDLDVGDFDGDGVLDLVGAGIGGNSYTFRNNIIPPPTMVFDVTLSIAPTSTVTVNYSTTDGTARTGVDYSGLSGTLTFLPGQTSQTIRVPVLGDNLAEPNETFFVNLSNAVGGVIVDSQAQGLITDDDGGVSGPRLSITDVSAAESNSTTTFNFTVSLSAASLTPVTVGYETGNGTAFGGFDYIAASGVVTFAPGQVSQTISVTVSGDVISEGAETFFVNLRDPVGATLADSQAVGLITDDDTLVLSADDTLLGGIGNDTLTSSTGNDVLVGGAGDDVVSGAEANDTLLGGAGNDSLFGNDGDDVLNGQAGNDSLHGGAGVDSVIWRGAGQGNDSLNGGDGSDAAIFEGSTSTNTLMIGQNSNGDLTIIDGTAVATITDLVPELVINGNGGNDSIQIGDISGSRLSTVIINGGDGDDVINASKAKLSQTNLLLNGDAGVDVILGSNFKEQINGGDDNDHISANGGDDIINGGAGVDTISGGDGADVINGSDGNDIISGDAGNDRIDGGLDNDVVDGGDGDDSIDGGEGDDVLIGSQGSDSINGNLGSDSLAGGAGDDSLDGGRGNDTINGNSGNDLIDGNHGDDSILAGAGLDTVRGGDGNDTISGGTEDDLVSGGDGNDYIDAGTGADVLIGGDGDDSLLGGDGSDTLLGEQGNDVLNGGGKSDVGAGGEGRTITISVELIDEQFVLPDTLLQGLLRT